GCAAKSNQFYKCTWCPKVSRKKPWGCMNAKESSTAQCWAVGGKDSLPGCGESCMAKDGDTGPCQSEKCRANCCQSPLCLCMGGGRSTGDTALSIGNT
ncbi:Hypothetical protein SCF082_LOCUS43654, partial [Durusdinium trenchii]